MHGLFGNGNDSSESLLEYFQSSGAPDLALIRVLFSRSLGLRPASTLITFLQILAVAGNLVLQEAESLVVVGTLALLQLLAHHFKNTLCEKLELTWAWEAWWWCKAS